MNVESISAVNSLTYKENQKTSSSFVKNDFFELISAQLKYQNPLEPLSDVEFMTQTAQFNLLEQVAELNNGFKEMLHAQELAFANGLIGKMISWIDGDYESCMGLVESVDFSGYRPMLIVEGKKLEVDEVISIINESKETPSSDYENTDELIME